MTLSPDAVLTPSNFSVQLTSPATAGGLWVGINPSRAARSLVATVASGGYHLYCRLGVQHDPGE